MKRTHRMAAKWIWVKLKSVYWRMCCYTGGRLPILSGKKKTSRQFSVQIAFLSLWQIYPFPLRFFCLSNLQFCRLATLNLKRGSNRPFVDMLKEYFLMMCRKKKYRRKRRLSWWCQIHGRWTIAWSIFGVSKAYFNCIFSKIESYLVLSFAQYDSQEESGIDLPVYNFSENISTEKKHDKTQKHLGNQQTHSNFVNCQSLHIQMKLLKCHTLFMRSKHITFYMFIVQFCTLRFWLLLRLCWRDQLGIENILLCWTL